MPSAYEYYITEANVIGCGIRAVLPREYRRKLTPSSKRLAKCVRILTNIAHGKYRYDATNIASRFYQRFTYEAALTTLRIIEEYAAVTYDDVLDDYERNRDVFSVLPVEYRDDRMNPEDARLIYAADVLERIIDGKEPRNITHFKHFVQCNDGLNSYAVYRQAFKYYKYHTTEAAEFVLECISNY